MARRKRKPARQKIPNKYRWYSCDAMVVGETQKAVGLSFEPDEVVELWAPKSQLECFGYVDGTKTKKVRIGQFVDSLYCAEWWAKRQPRIVGA